MRREDRYRGLRRRLTAPPWPLWARLALAVLTRRYWITAVQYGR